ncbi:hypothetical protein PV11_03013 [Exophiala sideris]|uniref:Uncharacterized protein n=1 Tax=Exophiala sideris TaxID=1016849 RepID=A0A0D1WFA3_9EURO|nr:hypothetical protein PV11_03013 [Exophiala sideris]
MICWSAVIYFKCRQSIQLSILPCRNSSSSSMATSCMFSLVTNHTSKIPFPLSKIFQPISSIYATRALHRPTSIEDGRSAPNSLDHQAVRLAFLHAEKRTFFQGETDHIYSFS